jgi:hypothetical protein
LTDRTLNCSTCRNFDGASTGQSRVVGNADGRIAIQAVIVYDVDLVRRAQNLNPGDAVVAGECHDAGACAKPSKDADHAIQADCGVSCNAIPIGHRQSGIGNLNLSRLNIAQTSFGNQAIARIVQALGRSSQANRQRLKRTAII